MDLKRTIKDWMLPIAMLSGASLYLIYHALPDPVHKAGPYLESAVSILQPLLIFSMLFLTFCRIEPRDLKPHRWHWWLLLIQGGLFSVLGLTIVLISRLSGSDTHACQVLIESAMLCLICPTATAAAVVTRKLGGDVPGITTYTVLINILVAVVVPLIVPLIHPMAGMTFWEAFSLILAKVLPLLILPCFCAWLVRYMMPELHRKLLEWQDLPFNLWVVALTLAIAVTTKIIVRSEMSCVLLMSMSVVSLVCCIFQFRTGRYVGSRYRPRTVAVRRLTSVRPHSADGKALATNRHAIEERGRQVRKTTAGQSLGQKNTVFAIWLGYTFMTPETAIVGGLYSIWHNLFNSWQLYRHEHQSDVKTKASTEAEE